MINQEDAEKLAVNFLIEEWDLSEEDQKCFLIKNSRKVPDGWWYFVEVGLNNLPDKWVLQVYEEGECDPCYTFDSPYGKEEAETDLNQVPNSIAEAIRKERCGHI